MAKPVPLTVLLASGQGMILAGAGRIVFLSAVETSGTAEAAWTFYNGNPGTLQGIMDYSLQPSESVREEWPDHGIPFLGDLWIGSISGAATLRVHIVPEGLWYEYKRIESLWVRDSFVEVGSDFTGVEVAHSVQ